VNEAIRLRMQAWRLSSTMGSAKAPDKIKRLIQKFDATMTMLRDGDLSRPLAVPWKENTVSCFRALEQGWQDLRPAWTAPGGQRGEDLTLREEDFVDRVDLFMQAIEDTLARLTAVLNLFQPSPDSPELRRHDLDRSGRRSPASAFLSRYAAATG
jgi:two-component system nitrate/nitrite sensor histidine kinase NarX